MLLGNTCNCSDFICTQTQASTEIVGVFQNEQCRRMGSNQLLNVFAVGFSLFGNLIGEEYQMPTTRRSGCLL